jgi:lipopolysaccharide biosynthesis regulator YciM
MSQQRSPSMIRPRRDQETLRRINNAKSLIQMGTMTNQVEEATNILQHVCGLLEQHVFEFDQQQLQIELKEQNPFSVLLAQARHRLGQIALDKGDWMLASRLFLQVILHEPHALSPAALAMSWYDVGLIYAHYGKVTQAQVALGQSFQTLMEQSQQTGVVADETLLYFIQIAMQRLVEMLEGRVTQYSKNLPFSSAFTVVTYNYTMIDLEDESSSDQVLRATERLLLDSKLWAAGAA